MRTSRLPAAAPAAAAAAAAAESAAVAAEARRAKKAKRDDVAAAEVAVAEVWLVLVYHFLLAVQQCLVLGH